MSFPNQHIGVVRTPFGQADIFIGRYPAGGAIAIQLIARGSLPEPLGTFSTKLIAYDVTVADDEFCVKGWSENEPLVAPMLATGLFEDTGRRVPAGFESSPIWRVKNAMHVPPVRQRAKRIAAAT